MSLHINQLEADKKKPTARTKAAWEIYYEKKRQLTRSKIKNGLVNSNLSATMVMAELRACLGKEVVDVVDRIHQSMVRTMRQNHTTTTFLMPYFPIVLGWKNVVGR